MKKGPTFKINDWLVKYIQVSFDNRYFIVTYKKNQIICKITSSCFLEDLPLYGEKAPTFVESLIV